MHWKGASWNKRGNQQTDYEAVSIMRKDGRMDWGWGRCGAKRN